MPSRAEQLCQCKPALLDTPAAAFSGWQRLAEERILWPAGSAPGDWTVASMREGQAKMQHQDKLRYASMGWQLSASRDTSPSAGRCKSHAGVVRCQAAGQASGRLPRRAGRAMAALMLTRMPSPEMESSPPSAVSVWKNTCRWAS